MKFPRVKLATVTGAWLSRRAKDIAARLLKTRGHGKTEVIDGYLIRATRAGSQASATLIDPPGLVVTKGWYTRSHRHYRVGQRDNFNSKVNATDGPYNLGEEKSEWMNYWFYAYGFDPNLPDGPFVERPWNNAGPIQYQDYHCLKRDIVRFSGLIRYPVLSNQLPIPVGSTIFSGVQTFGRNSQKTPGYWWSNERISELTGGYSLARVADIYPLGYAYQGDAPVSASRGDITLVVTPLVMNGPLYRDSAVVAWGESAVRFVLIQAGENAGASTELWSRIWTPDEHTCSFFHNGPWLSKPDTPDFSIVAGQPGFDDEDAWERWWETNTSGGSRPNWQDCMSATWHNGRFVVTLRSIALNGAYNPGSAEVEPMYLTAKGTAHMRFEISLDGAFSATEESYEIWNSPEEYGGIVGDLITPYSTWVAGMLDDARVVAAYPIALLPGDGWLAEVTLKTDSYRHELRQIIDTTARFGRYAYEADTVADRLEFRVTRTLPDGEDGLPTTHQVFFSDIGCGIDTLRLIVGVKSYRTAPSSKVRACDPQFAVISRNEIGFLARPAWRDPLSGPNNVLLVVFDLAAGQATVRADTGLVAEYVASHMLCPHFDCIQQAVYDDDGEVLLQGVLLATSRLSAASHISRDGGLTWAPYLTGLTNGPEYSAAAFFVGNQYGGGSKPGRAIQ